MHKDTHTEEWYHETCRPILRVDGIKISKLKNNPAHVEAVKAGVVRAIEKGKRIGRPIGKAKEKRGASKYR